MVFSVCPVLTGGSKKTVLLARKFGKPVLRLSRDGGPTSPDQALMRFVQDHNVKVLNVAGPRANKEPEVHGFVMATLTRTSLEHEAR